MSRARVTGFAWACLALAFSGPSQAATAAHTATSVEHDLRARFDGLRALLDLPSEATPRARLRARFPERADGVFELEGQGIRLTLRRLEARAVRVERGAGKLAYAAIAHDVDALHLLGDERSEEILLLRSPAAPTRFAYALAASGARDLRLEGGALYVRAADGRGLVLAPPVAFDALGRRSAQAARWELHDEQAPGQARLVLHVDATGLVYPLAIDPAWILISPPGTVHSNDAMSALLQDGRALLISGPAAITAVDAYDPASGLWSALPSLPSARVRATATLLRNGRLLLAGGFSPVGGGATNLCLIFDPATNAWSSTGSLLMGRGDHAATLLPDGRVLVTGGRLTSSGTGGLGNAEIYDPASGTWSNAGTHTQRHSHSATLLADARVLITGGANPTVLRSAEVSTAPYTSWTTAANMVQVRSSHAATLLPDGRVLVTGGTSSPTNAELYNPLLDVWTPTTGAMAITRQAHTANLLPNGRVLVAGGSGLSLTQTEVFDPLTGLFSNAGNLNSARSFHNTLVLPNGRLLAFSGFSGGAVTTAEVFDNDAGSWAGALTLGGARTGHSATLLYDGRVLVAGGAPGSTSVEIYAGGVWNAAAPLSQGRHDHSATLLGDGRVLVVGGEAGGTDLAHVETYDPSTGAWTTEAPLSTPRRAHTATLLPCGEVLVTGGESSGASLASAERFNPLTGQWRAAANPSAARFDHTATLLPNGRVLVTGGQAGVGLSSAEIYDPLTDTWSPTAGPMSVAREQHTATLLLNGRVLVAGRPSGGGPGASTEIFDPLSSTFVVTGAMSTPRVRHAATLLPNGKLLVSGGSVTGVLASSELYDPAVGSWSSAGLGLLARELHTTTLLPSGRVLAAGGQNVVALSSSQEYDVGRGEVASWRPQVLSVSSPLVSPGAVLVNGSGLRGVSEASTGNGPRQSATNYPIVQLRRLDNEASGLLPAEGVLPSWSDTLFRSRIVSAQPGPALVTVFANGIPGDARTLRVECPAAGFSAHPSSQTVCQGASATFAAAATGDCLVYRWRRAGVPLGDGGPYSGTGTSSLSVGPVTPALAGAFDLQLRTPCSSTTSTSASAALNLTIQPPAFDGLENVAPIGGTCGFRLEWTPAATTCPAPGASTLRYNVYRSTSPGFTPGPTNLVASCVNAPFYNDVAGIASGTTYYYVVRAEDGTAGFGGQCNDGVEEGNLLRLSGLITGACSPSSAPSDVLPLVARARSDETRVEWRNPTLGPYGSTTLRYRTDAPPTGPTDGTLLAVVGGAPGEKVTLDHTGLTNGTTYHYGAFVENGLGTYSAGAGVASRPDSTAGALRWAFSTQASALSAPGVLPNAAYFAVSNDRFLHAMGAGAGGGAWPALWASLPTSAPSKGRPVVANLPTTTVGGAHRIALIGALDGRVYAANADTGAGLWVSPVLGSALSAAPSAMFVDAGGSADLVLVGTREAGGDSRFFGLRLADGSLAWNFDNGGPGNGIGIIGAQARVDYATNRVFFTSRRNPSGSADTVWCLSFSGSSAVKLWSSPLPGDVDASPVLFNGTLYVGNLAGQVYAFDPATGTPKWSAPYATGDGPVKGLLFPQSAPTRLYFSTTNQVHAILDNGGLAAPYWSAPVGLPSPSPAIVANGRVYVGGAAGRLYSIDALAPTPPAPTSVQLGDPLVPKLIGAPTYDTLLDLVVAGSDEGVIYAVQAPF